MEAPAGRGTVVEASLRYDPPGGEVGRLIAKLFQREPAIQARRELKRLKMLMETGRDRHIRKSQGRRGLTGRTSPCAHSPGTASTTSASRPCPTRRS
jgi:hypothetical protein